MHNVSFRQLLLYPYIAASHVLPLVALRIRYDVHDCSITPRLQTPDGDGSSVRQGYTGAT